MAAGIKPEAWLAVSLRRLSFDARLLWAAMVSAVDYMERVRYTPDRLGVGLAMFDPLEAEAALADLRRQGMIEYGEDHRGPFERLLLRKTLWSFTDGGSAPRETKPAQVAAYRHLYADPCAYCGAPSAAIDHIVPWSAGGRDEDGMNLTGACRRCNAKKHAKPLLHFLLERAVA